jgi:hypothetical protein
LPERKLRRNDWAGERADYVSLIRPTALATSVVFPRRERGPRRHQVSFKSAFEIPVGFHRDLILLHGAFDQINGALKQDWQHRNFDRPMRRGEVCEFVSKLPVKFEYLPMLLSSQSCGIFFTKPFDEYAELGQMFRRSISLERFKPIQHLDG